MNKPRVLFVYDLKHDEYWKDGLWAALEILEDDFEISRINLVNLSETDIVDFNDFDFILGWGGFSSSVDTYIKLGTEMTGGNPRNVTKGLCIGGNAFPPEGADNYDVLFYETKWYRPQINFHKNIVHAFGVNTDIYHPNGFPTPLIWDFIGVGSLAKWKRWEKMSQKRGNRLVIGEYQENNEQESLEIVRELLKNNVMVSNLTNPLDYVLLLLSSRKLYIPADINGGGERAILEARACGLDVEIEEDNPKLKELTTGPIWDQKYYASQLKKGILSAL